MPHWLKWVLLGLIFILIGSVPLAMQFGTGYIFGTVANELGPVPNVMIEAHRDNTDVITSTESDITGRYRLADLQAGRYSVSAQAVDRTPIWTQNVIVEPGRGTRLDLRFPRLYTKALVKDHEDRAPHTD